MDENTTAVKVFDAVPTGKRRGRPTLGWKDQAGYDLASQFNKSIIVNSVIIA